MKEFIRLEFDPNICHSQLAELRQLLQSKRGLSEKDDISPEFDERARSGKPVNKSFTAFFEQIS
ncbi:MAG TPA: hypothetical protein DDW51_07400 [Cyanobacteria bacterium UBA11367]|nr:hypothetical protein [Cyanobacteria bacterium UBA11367]